jgi:hypothetical protein
MNCSAVLLCHCHRVGQFQEKISTENATKTQKKICPEKKILNRPVGFEADARRLGSGLIPDDSRKVLLAVSKAPAVAF